MTTDHDNSQPVTLAWALALTFVTWFAEGVLSMVLRPWLLRLGLQPMAAASLIRVVCFGLVFTAMLHGSGLRYRRLFHEGSASAVATLGVLSGPLLLTVPLILLIDGLIMGWLVAVWPMSGAEVGMFGEMLDAGLGNWILACLIAPVIEEMFFRGVLLRGMLKAYEPSDAMVYSAFVFGMAHLNIYQCVIAFLIGLPVAALYVRTRSLWPGIVLHAGVNTGVMLLAALGGPDDGRAPLAVWAVAAVCAGYGGWTLRRLLWPRGAASPLNQ